MKGKIYKSDMEWVTEPGRYLVDENGCWNWQGHIDKHGYGTCRWAGTRFAHRAVFLILSGPIPKGDEIDHLCKNRRCVNPSHLEAVSASENRRRAQASHRNRVKTHCIRGHVFSGYNKVEEKGPNGEPRRRCRTCAVAGTKRRRAEKRISNASI